MAIHLHGNLEEELQSAVPDVVWAQYKPFHAGRTSEDKVLPIKSEIFLILERPAMQTLEALVYCVANLQYTVDADVSLSFYSRADLPKMIYYYILLRYYYYVLLRHIKPIITYFY